MERRPVLTRNGTEILSGVGIEGRTAPTRLESLGACWFVSSLVFNRHGPIKRNQECNNQRATSKKSRRLRRRGGRIGKGGKVLTSTGNTKGTPMLTATGTSSNSDLNVGGLRRSTRAASKTPADPKISKGATVPTPDPTGHVCYKFFSLFSFALNIHITPKKRLSYQQATMPVENSAVQCLFLTDQVVRFPGP
ncbi:hypothetical protein H4Q26_010761 [Puccinia striiformis f. sp. tritici PST-130]|nr:hypothetical protein H4Q26_010761 [Puccinia striiformis f. sp. tritici PST-130]